MTPAQASAQIKAWRFVDVRAFQRATTWNELALDGQVGPRTAEAVERVVAEGGRLSANFHLDEFRSRGNGQVKIHRVLIAGLEALRNELGHPIRIVSAYRDPAHNRSIGGATNSAHLYGAAVDVDGLDQSSVRRVKRFSGIGITRATGRVAHVDIRGIAGVPATTPGTVDAPMTWFYPRG